MTPVGTFQVSGVNLTGQSSQSFPVTFKPNGINGSFSGSVTLDLTGSSSVSLTINFSGTSMVPTATAGLKYQVLSILYSPPGNASSNGYSNAISQGATTSVSQNFSASDSISFKGAAPGASNAVTFSTSASTGNGSSFTTNYQATSGSQVSSVAQAINHNQDQVYLLIDPSIVVTQTGATTGFFTLGGSLDATGSFGASGPPPDILNVNIAGLKNPSLIPIEILLPQVPEPGVTLPGLASVCAKPLPANACTQQNACGCTAADFAPIVAQDELANVTNQSMALNAVDPARYVFINNISLQGPDQQGAGPVKNTFALTDGTVSGETTSNGSSYGVSYSHTFGGGIGGFDLSITNTTGFTFSQSQTAGTSNGITHTGTATLGTSDVGCFEDVDVYEDTTYHTFAFALPQAAPSNCQ
jgi:hypothetical protein